MRRAVRVVLIAIAFASFWSVGFLLATLILPFARLFAGKRDEAKLRVGQRIVNSTFRIFHGYMRVLGLLDARVGGPIPRRPDDGPVVIVCNHTTLVDVTAILSRYLHVCSCAKTSLTESLLVGHLLRWTGHIPATHIDLAVRRLEQGFDVLVFPEGTRSPPNELNPFRRGAFEIAKRAGVPIALFRSTCVPSALTKELRFWQQPAERAVLTIEPIGLVLPEEFGTDTRALMAHVESVYVKALGIDKA